MTDSPDGSEDGIRKMQINVFIVNTLSMQRLETCNEIGHADRGTGGIQSSRRGFGNLPGLTCDVWWPDARTAKGRGQVRGHLKGVPPFVLQQPLLNWQSTRLPYLLV